MRSVGDYELQRGEVAPIRPSENDVDSLTCSARLTVSSVQSPSGATQPVPSDKRQYGVNRIRSLNVPGRGTRIVSDPRASGQPLERRGRLDDRSGVADPVDAPVV